MSKEDDILLRNIEDKIDKCMDDYRSTNSIFLDLRQRSLAENSCKRRSGLQFIFYGGYEEAERTIALFLPDYISLSNTDFKTIHAYFQENEEDNPLALLRIINESSKGKELSHRDYLGALTGLGVKREMIGDILVRKDGADIIILKEMADFLMIHYEKAGRAYLNAEVKTIAELIVPEGQFEEIKDTVASLRIDNVVASAFRTSRGKAAEAITGGFVFLNGIQTDKTDKQVKEGDKLVLRGKGKVILQEIGGSTRKDRVFIILKKYL
ncbi:RNA-binding protein [Clostridium aminobutyricum]|uniref:RNA-binding protein n=1 Tax=Clostridium aminobutyricum TaxID=33953 RepID=A0A939D7J9_CLOAM|nr:YlmH/Sll1252 family protein [Clostridium aminobutyricum]MBN7772203.1 RNA-binding protein [Clostridium aminobutyricum]